MCELTSRQRHCDAVCGGLVCDVFRRAANDSAAPTTGLTVGYEPAYNSL
jgi:hypothetical protein